MPRPIDATKVVQAIIAIRDKIPLETVERYSFGVPSPYRHGQSMRGGIRKALREIEQAPTLDYAPVRHGDWLLRHVGHGHYWECSECHTNPCIYVTENTKFCPNCGAKMDGNSNNGV